MAQARHPGVLFLCTGNSARSQMAEGLMREFSGDQFTVYSAGTAPKGLNPFAIRAMKEIGIDISGHRSKDVGELLGKAPIGHLIVVCSDAEKKCPVAWPGILTRDFWPIPDPAAVQGSDAERLEAFRDARDEIKGRIETWVKQHVAPQPA